MLEIKNLVKKFGPVGAVNKVTLNVKAGEIYALIGPNGSGKTTLIKTVAGLLRPTAGEVRVGGADVKKDPAATKQLIGYVPDEPSVWPAMTGEEFLHFTGALFGVAENERAKKISGLLKIFGLEGIEKGYFEDYSRGNKQKFTIIAALLHKPKLLLVDEPIVGLDPTSAEVAKNEFKKFAAGGGAVLLATHTLPVAQEIADTIGVLREGKLLASAPFPKLVSRARLGRSASLEDVYLVLTK